MHENTKHKKKRRKKKREPVGKKEYEKQRRTNEMAQLKTACCVIERVAGDCDEW